MGVKEGSTPPAMFASRLSVRRASALVFGKHGSPTSVLRMIEFEPAAPKQNEVLVRMLAAPIHPVDLDIISGKLPGQPLSPDGQTFAGVDGVGEITQVGPGVSNLAVGDRVVPRVAGLGTWRTHLTCSSNSLLKVSREISPESAIMMPGAVHTAFGLLSTVAKLQEGDLIVQNAATSAVGQLVIQIAASRGIQTVNIISPRPDSGEIRERLKRLGGTVVVDVDYVDSDLMDNILSDEAEAVLGIDGQGGDSLTAVQVVLGDEAPLVRYGRALDRPCSRANAARFDLQKYLQSVPATTLQNNLKELEQLLANSSAKVYLERHSFGDRSIDSIARSQDRFVGRKVFFSMEGR
eukprot:c13062_g1_i1.p1 GENE.c13062_g1_i1~~c13062_g1_i1.p1  ORF type:complete len:350 (-),score=76.54 c13062_g1_i1:32-1081(-)